MNQYIGQISSGSVKASDIPDWALSHGIGALTTGEIAHLIGTPVSHISQRMTSHRKEGRIFSPARGLWVPIEPEYRTWGAPDPMAYIDDMMAYLGTDYRIGWLSAAALHGASHHAAQIFQVAVERPIKSRIYGRSRLEFYSRDKVSLMAFSRPTRQKAKVASIGTTMLMLASDIAVCGGIDNVATLITELAEENPGFEAELTSDAHLFSDAAVRRVGWLLDEFGRGAPSEMTELNASLESALSFLSPDDKRTGRLNSKWSLILNKKVDPDL